MSIVLTPRFPVFFFESGAMLAKLSKKDGRYIESMTAKDWVGVGGDGGMGVGAGWFRKMC